MKNLVERIRICLFGTQVVTLTKAESSRMKRRCVRW